MALDQLAGGLSTPLNRLRADLIDLLADLEAGLDFVEDDIRFVSSTEVGERLAHAKGELDKLQQLIGRRSDGQMARRVVLLGWSNVGKSALFNALASNAAAIVSAQSGTTRDYLQSPLALDGTPCLLVDTAGIDSCVDGIAAAAQRFADEQRKTGDLLVLCLDSSRPLNHWEQEQLTERQGHILVWTKCDLGRPRADLARLAIETSAVARRGLDELRAEVAKRINDRETREGVVASTAARCNESVTQAGRAIDQAIQLASVGAGEELVATEIRVALDELGRVVGAVYTDDLLDRVFSRFCIGK
jgi:tRNA modification GTPase